MLAARLRLCNSAGINRNNIWNASYFLAEKLRSETRYTLKIREMSFLVFSFFLLLHRFFFFCSFCFSIAIRCVWIFFQYIGRFITRGIHFTSGTQKKEKKKKIRRNMYPILSRFKVTATVSLLRERISRSLKNCSGTSNSADGVAISSTFYEDETQKWLWDEMEWDACLNELRCSFLKWDPRVVKQPVHSLLYRNKFSSCRIAWQQKFHCCSLGFSYLCYNFLIKLRMTQLWRCNIGVPREGICRFYQ